MSAINTGGGAGIHPGAPVIWPRIPQQKVEQTEASKEVVETSRQIQQQAAPTSTSSAAPVQQAAPPPSAAQTPPTRPMSMNDIVQQLMELGIPNTADNTQLASLMMQHGVELSPKSFENLYRLLKGKTDNFSMQSAVIALTKGLSESANSVGMLQTFLSQSPQLTGQITGLQQAIARFQFAFQNGQSLLSSGIQANLTEILSQFDTELKKLQRSSVDKGALSNLNRGPWIRDIRAMMQFLQGLKLNLQNSANANSPQAKELGQQMSELQEKLTGFLEHLTTQAILSKDGDKQIPTQTDKFFYWALPNPYNTTSNVEIMVRKDKNVKGEINPEKTRLYLKVDTPDLGEITIIIDVLDNKVWYIFNSEREETRRFIAKMNNELKERMVNIGKNLVGFQTVVRTLDLKKILIPTLSLDDVMRISTEA